MVIIETPTFTRLIRELISDESYRALQEVLAAQPDLGELIRGSGGLRKVRWGLIGKGKRGGVRVIYYWVVPDEHIYMLFAYAKATRGDLTPEQIKQLKGIVEGW